MLRASKLTRSNSCNPFGAGAANKYLGRSTRAVNAYGRLENTVNDIWPAISAHGVCYVEILAPKGLRSCDGVARYHPLYFPLASDIVTRQSRGLCATHEVALHANTKRARPGIP